MQIVHWDDYHVVFQVAQLGSLTKAAKQLQCNHSTVLRHVNRLEKALSVKLFIRHQRGYKLSDAGTILMNEMPAIYTEFSRLENMLGSVDQDISGNLRISTLHSFSSSITPALLQFRKEYPKLRLQLITTDEVVPLANGLVHVSLRAGPKPHSPDLIVKKIITISMSYYANEEYVQQHGLPTTAEQYNQHDWVMPSADKYHIPLVKQVMKYLDNERVVYQSNQLLDVQAAVKSGMGIGLILDREASGNSHLHKLEIEKEDEHLHDGLWYVYHRDLKLNAKVQALYQYLVTELGE